MEGMQARWARASLEFWGEKGGISVAEVTLVKLPLQALHLRLVSAHAIDAFGAQPWQGKKSRYQCKEGISKWGGGL